MSRLLLAVSLLLFAASCGDIDEPTTLPTPLELDLEETASEFQGDEIADPEVKLVPKIYRITTTASHRIPHRVLDAVNAVRQTQGLTRVILSSELTAAAKTHARDMAIQNRPWHFGSDGSSLFTRAANAGYEGRVLGENIAESFESDLETLSAWMDDERARSVILAPEATRIGIGWHQESDGRIWWCLVVGAA